MTTKYLILLQKVIKTPHIGFERATESQRTQINARQVELILGLLKEVNNATEIKFSKY